MAGGAEAGGARELAATARERDNARVSAELMRFLGGVGQKVAEQFGDIEVLEWIENRSVPFDSADAAVRGAVI
jgi:hypothetical protein